MKLNEAIETNARNCVNCGHLKTKVRSDNVLVAVCKKDIIAVGTNGKGWQIFRNNGYMRDDTPKAWDHAERCLEFTPMF